MNPNRLTARQQRVVQGLGAGLVYGAVLVLAVVVALASYTLIRGIL